MIRFNKFPPALPGDVELAESASELFSESPVTTKQATAYGQSVGVTVLSAMEKPHALLAEDIVEPLSEQFNSLIEDADNQVYFRQGLLQGIECQAKALELAV